MKKKCIIKNFNKKIKNPVIIVSSKHNWKQISFTVNYNMTIRPLRKLAKTIKSVKIYNLPSIFKHIAQCSEV